MLIVGVGLRALTGLDQGGRRGIDATQDSRSTAPTTSTPRAHLDDDRAMVAVQSKAMRSVLRRDIEGADDTHRVRVDH